jgi:hypothetical protein
MEFLEMNIKEAEEFFKKYHGHGYHMWHDDPVKNREFDSMKISPELKEQWRQDLIQDFFEHMLDDPDKIWLQHDNVLKIIESTKTNLEENCTRFLDIMEEFHTLDKKQKVLIIENMAGRTNPQEDGGCYLICAKTDLKERMHNIMLKIMDFECTADDNLRERGWNDIRTRFHNALNAYDRAYAKFKNL